jgi:hypothetical protein
MTTTMDTLVTAGTGTTGQRALGRPAHNFRDYPRTAAATGVWNAQ